MAIGTTVCAKVRAVLFCLASFWVIAPTMAATSEPTTEKWPASDYADYCHFNEAAAKRLGEIVASCLAKVAGL